MCKANDDFLNQSCCDRCGNKLELRTMSYMNEDTLCLNCAKTEKDHPKYKEAKQAEFEAINAGITNYPGLFGGIKYEDIPV